MEFNDELSFYLLNSLLGNEFDRYNESYAKEYVRGETYEKLKQNILKAYEYNTTTSLKLVTDFNNLSYKVTNFKDLVILQTKLTILYSLSFPAYYVNPLLDNSKCNLNVSSLGELKVYCDYDYYTISELIANKKIPTKYKEEAITKQVITYYDDASKQISSKIDKIKVTSGIKSALNYNNIQNHFANFCFGLTNFMFLFILIFNNEFMRDAFFYPTISDLYTYIVYFPLVSVIVFDIIFIIYRTYTSYVFKNYNYAKRFIARKEYLVYKNLKQKSLELKYYLLLALEKKITLMDDFNKFSFDSSIVSFEDFSITRKKTLKTPYIIVRSFVFLFLLIAFIAVTFSTIALIILSL